MRLLKTKAPSSQPKSIEELLTESKSQIKIVENKLSSKKPVSELKFKEKGETAIKVKELSKDLDKYVDKKSKTDSKNSRTQKLLVVSVNESNERKKPTKFKKSNNLSKNDNIVKDSLTLEIIEEQKVNESNERKKQTKSKKSKDLSKNDNIVKDSLTLKIIEEEKVNESNERKKQTKFKKSKDLSKNDNIVKDSLTLEIIEEEKEEVVDVNTKIDDTIMEDNVVKSVELNSKMADMENVNDKISNTYKLVDLNIENFVISSIENKSGCNLENNKKVEKKKRKPCKTKQKINKDDGGEKLIHKKKVISDLKIKRKLTEVTEKDDKSDSNDRKVDIEREVICKKRRKKDVDKSKELLELPPHVEDGVFILCDLCHKFRQLKYIYYPTDAPRYWTCNMHQNGELTCDSPPEDFSQFFDCFINNKFTLGSIVWARATGYCWWPALVDDDPDIDMFFWCFDDTDDVSHYHVCFLDKHVSRSWVTVNNIRHFSGSIDMEKMRFVCGKRDFTVDVKEAVVIAEDAIEMSLEERLKKYRFLSRYEGKSNKWTREQTKEQIKPLKLKQTTHSMSTSTSRRIKKCDKDNIENNPNEIEDTTDLAKVASLLEEESQLLINSNSQDEKEYEEDDSLTNFNRAVSKIVNLLVDSDNDMNIGDDIVVNDEKEE